MIDNFNEAIKVLLGMEGGYSNNPLDLGGETNFGISEKQYPNLNIKNLSIGKAKDIYYIDYWLRNKLDKIKDKVLSKQLLQAYVNISSFHVTVCLQKALSHCGCDIQIDGILGSITLKYIDQINNKWLSDRLRIELIIFYEGRVTINESQKIFFLGWIRRSLL